jgi:hypothetical protein
MAEHGSGHGLFYTKLRDTISNVFVDFTGLSIDICHQHGMSWETWNNEEYIHLKPTEEQFNQLFDQKCAEDPDIAMGMLRFWRQNKLSHTDYMFSSDYQHSSEEIKQAWINYRQALRDLPQNSTPVFDHTCLGDLVPKNVTWPTKPE